MSWIQENGFKIGFFLALLSVAASLGFSDIYHVEPCKLCWWQRIFHYPLAIIFLIGWKYRDLKAWSYSLYLSAAGLLIALRQIMLQFNISNSPNTDCALDAAADCSAIHMLEFGYITFPLMSATLFSFMIFLYLIHRYYKKPHQK